MGMPARIVRTAVLGGLGLALLVGLTILGARAGWRYDATANKRHSLAEPTVKALKGLSVPVKAVAFLRPGEGGKDRLEDLLGLYGRESRNFSFEVVDPDRAPYRAKELDVVQVGEVVLLCGDRREKIFSPDEEKLTNAVVRVSDARRPVIYVLDGHGELARAPRERGSASRFLDVLAKQGSEVRGLTLATAPEAPKDASLIMVLGPVKDLLPHELAALTSYFATGGRLLVAVSERPTNLDRWLKEQAGVERRPGLVVDKVGLSVTGDYLAAIVVEYGFHPIVKDFDIMTLFPTAAALYPADPESPVKVLCKSSQESWLETDMAGLEQGRVRQNTDPQRRGPIPLAVAEESPKKEDGKGGGRLVAFGDQDFLSDQYLGLSGNADLAKNSVNWLLDREGLITIARPKPLNALLFPAPGQGLFLTWLPLAGVPGLLVALAVSVALRRRKGR